MREREGAVQIEDGTTGRVPTMNEEDAEASMREACKMVMNQ